MRWSARVARVAGIEIRIHATFPLLLAWIAWASYAEGGTAAAAGGVVFILLLFASVVLHELGHAAAARRFGIATPDITLLPIGGVARLQRMPREPRQELVIALAGPAVTALIALALWILLSATGTAEQAAARLDDPALGIPYHLLAANVILLAFNLLPAFPMDGGRVLRALLAMRMDYVRATRAASRTGQVFAFGFGMVGLLYNPLLVLVALFVYVAAAQEAQAVQMHALAERIPVSAAMLTGYRALPAAATLAEAADALLTTSEHEFPVVDADGRALGVLTRAALLSGLEAGGPDAPVSGVMRGGVPPATRATPLDEAVRRMEEARVPALPVVDDDGRLVGLLTPDNVGEAMLVDGALRRHGNGSRPG